MNKSIKQLIIIGSGPAGITAALYAGRAHLQPLVIEGEKTGGQLMGTSIVENWPGTSSILGPDLMMNMKKQAEQWGATFLSASVEKVDFSEQPFRIQTGQQTLHTQSVIIATGASAKKLNCPGEEEYWGRGVTTCAVCDAPLYKNKSVIVVGGGDTAMENASSLRKYTDKITIIQTNSELTASASMKDRILRDKAFTILYNSTITNITGNGSQVTSITIHNKQSNQETSLPTNGLFISIGLNPNTALFKGQVDLDPHGYIILRNGSTTETSVPGIFAAGDVHDFRYRQAIVAAGSGCMASLDAERFLQNIKPH